MLTRCTLPPAGTPITCAYSGGADSTALIALAEHAGCRVIAVHIDHGLRPTSRDEATRARSNAATLGIECTVVSASVAPGPNVEARAREARIAHLPADAATAHTADDQAETVLLALLRGSGARGLAGMRPGPTKPLLALRRRETHALCAALDVEPVLDPTNIDARFRRNAVRNEVIPTLDRIAQRDVVELLTRTADLLRADDDLLAERARDIDPTDAAALAAAPIPIARRAVRRWLHDGVYPPDAAAVERVLAVARGDRVACEVGGRRIARRSGKLSLAGTLTTDG